MKRFAVDGFSVKTVEESKTIDFPDFLYPKHLCIFLTTRCNIRCRICPRDNYHGIDMDFNNIFKLDKVIKHAKTIDLTGWGECFVYPKINEVLNHIYSLRSDACLQITTNGTLLSADTGRQLHNRIKKMIISLNAATPGTYNRDMKYSDFNKTIIGIKEFMTTISKEDRKKVSLHFVAHANNFREIPEFVLLAKSLGIFSVSIGNFLASSLEDCSITLLNVKYEYNNTIADAHKIAIESDIALSARIFGTEIVTSTISCKDPFDACFINPDGKIGAPCCYSGEYLMGNVYETSFDDVWFNEKFENLRRHRHLQVCQSCVPFSPLDFLECHISGEFRKTTEFNEYKIAKGL